MCWKDGLSYQGLTWRKAGMTPFLGLSTSTKWLHFWWPCLAAQPSPQQVTNNIKHLQITCMYLLLKYNKQVCTLPLRFPYWVNLCKYLSATNGDMVSSCPRNLHNSTGSEAWRSKLLHNPFTHGSGITDVHLAQGWSECNFYGIKIHWILSLRNTTWDYEGKGDS